MIFLGLLLVAVVQSVQIRNGDYSVGDGGDYEYSIDYKKTLEEYTDITSPSCGREIEQMEVDKISAPNQIRLSYTGDPTEMALTWTTNDIVHIEEVRYGLLEADLNNTAVSISHQYQWDKQDDGSYLYTSGFIHEALMVNLIPGKIHYYKIYSNGEESEVRRFLAAPDPGSDTPVSFLHVGDVGTFGTSVMVTNDMMKRMEEHDFHGMIHCGDISYANKYNGTRKDRAVQKVWDTWGQMVQPIGSRMAYMVTPGNHELDPYDSTMENATIYQKRFIMPGNERYYSFGVGMVHFVAVSTDESIDGESTQGVWLENTLKKINANRETWPWLVVFQHRPIYNSNKNHGNWTGSNNYENGKGFPDPDYHGWPDHFESLLLEYNVDLVLAGHVHHYERSWPVWKRNHTQQSYTDVSAPVHITCGHAGKGLYKWVWDSNKTKDTYEGPVPEFSAARGNTEWGHCELQFTDRNTVNHKMYVMGSEEPKEDVTITKKRSSSSAAVHLSSLTFLVILAQWTF